MDNRKPSPVFWAQTDRVRSLDHLVAGLESGQVGRRSFLIRAAGLGLSLPLASAILSACSSSSDSPAASSAPSTTGSAPTPTSAPGASLAEISSIVYPLGLASRLAYEGPNDSVQDAAEMPLDYHVEGENGTWDWNFANFKADRSYKLAYCNASSQYDTGVELGARFQRLAERLGCTVDIFDNNFDADAAIRNADLIIQQGYDFVHEFQVLPDVNRVLHEKFTAAGIGVNFLAIEATGVPEAQLLDGDNFGRSREVGLYIGNYMKDNFDGQVDLVILGAQPRTGAYAATREAGFLAGLREVLPDIPDSIIESIDTEAALLDVAQTKATDLLTANPDAKYIVGWGTNDDAAVGIVRALELAGRDEFAAVGGQGGLPSAITELERSASAFKVSAFFDIGAWTWMMPIGVLGLMGGETSVYNLIPAPLYDSSNIGEFPTQIAFS
jgi:ABC-type sugar transport system substrate-binding protein